MRIRPALTDRHHGRSSIRPRISAHSALTWTTLLLAIASYVLTILYAWHPGLVSRNPLFGSTPAKALRLLAILSGVANFLLGASISQAFDLIRGMLIARRRGLRLLPNLALQPGTSLDGHAEIIFTGHRGGMKPRAWSLLKATSMVVVPILGIVILREVDAVSLFYQKTSEPVAKGYGVGPFNATLAPLLQPMADALFGSRFKDFPSDTDLVANVTPDSDRKRCSDRSRNGTHVGCRTQYLVPGGIEQFAPELLLNKQFTGDDDIQPVLAKDHQSQYFYFEESGPIAVDQNVDCVRHGYSIGAYQLCLKDTGEHHIAAYLATCPRSLAANLSCLDNSSWPLDEGWGTTFSVSSRPANIGYNGLNGTIMFHSFPNDNLTPIDVTAPQLIQVFSTLFAPPHLNSTYGSLLDLLGLGGKKAVEPLIIWQHFQGLVDLSKADSRANRRAMVGLQALLMIPIYHLQAKDFIELRKLLLAQLEGSAVSKTLGGQILDLFPDVKPLTDIYPAVIRYTLRVGRASLIAYIVIAGCTLFAYLAVNALASLTQSGKKSSNMGPFPLLTHLCDCRTMPHDNHGRQARGPFLPISKKHRLYKAVHMNVTLVADDDDTDLEGR